jgi:hypothetical protein
VVDGVFVVDPPAVKIRPRLFGGALQREATLLQHGHGRLKFVKLEPDRIVGLRVEVDLPAE